MFAAVNHVHHRHGHRHRAGTADVAVERQAGIFGGCAGNGHRHGQSGVGAQAAFVVGTVQIEHDLVDIGLLAGIHTDQRLGDFVVYVLNSLQHTFAQIAAFVAVAQLQSFFLAGRRA